MLESKLGITDSAELARIEEKSASRKRLKCLKVNISKGNFRSSPLMYLNAILQSIDKMPQSTFDKIKFLLKMLLQTM